MQNLQPSHFSWSIEIQFIFFSWWRIVMLFMPIAELLIHGPILKDLEHFRGLRFDTKESKFGVLHYSFDSNHKI
jgi:hypothetical protein